MCIIVEETNKHRMCVNVWRWGSIDSYRYMYISLVLTMGAFIIVLCAFIIDLLCTVSSEKVWVLAAAAGMGGTKMLLKQKNCRSSFFFFFYTL